MTGISTTHTYRPQPRRRVVFQLDGQTLVEMFKESDNLRCYKITKGLPSDAKIIGAEYNSNYDRWEVAIESETFNEIPIWEKLPILGPIEATSHLGEHLSLLDLRDHVEESDE